MERTYNLKATELPDGSWYLTSDDLPGFRYIVNVGDDMETGLRLISRFVQENKK